MSPDRVGRPAPLTGAEYQRMYDTGVMPERYFDWEAAELRDKFIAGEIDLVTLEADLDPSCFREDDPNP